MEPINEIPLAALFTPGNNDSRADALPLDKTILFDSQKQLDIMVLVRRGGLPMGRSEKKPFEPDLDSRYLDKPA